MCEGRPSREQRLSQGFTGLCRTFQGFAGKRGGTPAAPAKTTFEVKLHDTSCVERMWVMVYVEPENGVAFPNTAALANTNKSGSGHPLELVDEGEGLTGLLGLTHRWRHHATVLALTVQGYLHCWPTGRPPT